MKFLIVLVAALAVASSDSADQAAEIVKFENDAQPDGSYKFSFETSNGIAVGGQGEPRNFGGNPPVVPVVSQGYYSFYTPDGQANSISYIADENGYQASGSGIPTPPPTPPAILKALDYLARSGQLKK